MPKRPLSITIISWFFIVAGAIGFVYHATEINIHNLFGDDLLLVLFVRLLAVAGGIFLLRGASWARYLLIAWLVYHVVLSFFHTFAETAMHAALFGMIAFFLFRPKANEYFKGK